MSLSLFVLSLHNRETKSRILPIDKTKHKLQEQETNCMTIMNYEVTITKQKCSACMESEISGAYLNGHHVGGRLRRNIIPENDDHRITA